MRRLATLTIGARPVVVADVFPEIAHRVALTRPGMRVADDSLAAIEAPQLVAVVVAMPGHTRAELVEACLRRGVPAPYEKPLTTDPDSFLALVRANAVIGRRLVQVGFMRRFDAEYAGLRRVVEAGELVVANTRDSRPTAQAHGRVGGAPTEPHPRPGGARPAAPRRAPPHRPGHHRPILSAAHHDLRTPEHQLGVPGGLGPALTPSRHSGRRWDISTLALFGDQGHTVDDMDQVRAYVQGVRAD